MKNKLQLQAISPRSDRNANHPKDRRAAEGTVISIYASHFTMACPLNCPQSPCCPHRACRLKYVPCSTIVSQRTLAIQSYAVTRRLYCAASAHGRVVYYVRVSMQKADMQVCYAAAYTNDAEICAKYVGMHAGKLLDIVSTADTPLLDTPAARTRSRARRAAN